MDRLKVVPDGPPRGRIQRDLLPASEDLEMDLQAHREGELCALSEVAEPPHQVQRRM